MTRGPSTNAGRALLAREDYNERSFALITADAVAAVEIEAAAAAALEATAPSTPEPALDPRVVEAFDLLGGMWSWSEENGYFASSNGYALQAGRLLREVVGRPATPPALTSESRAAEPQEGAARDVDPLTGKRNPEKMRQDPLTGKWHP